MAVDHKQFDDFAKRFAGINAAELKKLEKDCVSELAARLLRSVVKATPVGIYPSGSGKVGGTLRRGWEIGTATNNSTGAEVRLINPTEYASYVEYGHRTRGGTGWVEGRFMMTNAVDTLRPKAQAIVDKKIAKYMEDRFNGK